jgi:hypothetical protein
VNKLRLLIFFALSSIGAYVHTGDDSQRAAHQYYEQLPIEYTTGIVTDKTNRFYRFRVKVTLDSKTLKKDSVVTFEKLNKEAKLITQLAVSLTTQNPDAEPQALATNAMKGAYSLYAIAQHLNNGGVPRSPEETALDMYQWVSHRLLLEKEVDEKMRDLNPRARAFAYLFTRPTVHELKQELIRSTAGEQ